MSFIKKIFDIKKCARNLRRYPDAPERKRDPDALLPTDLTPCMQSAYVQVLRYDTINIKELNFDEIGDGDIDDLENVLYHSPANELFSLGDVFKRLNPSAAGRVFI